MTPHPCPYCNNEMYHVEGAVYRCTACTYTEGTRDDQTQQNTLQEVTA